MYTGKTFADVLVKFGSLAHLAPSDMHMLQMSKKNWLKLEATSKFYRVFFGLASNLGLCARVNAYA